MNGYYKGDVIIFDTNNIGIVVDDSKEDIVIEEISSNVVRVRNSKYDTANETMKKLSYRILRRYQE